MSIQSVWAMRQVRQGYASGLSRGAEDWNGSAWSAATLLRTTPETALNRALEMGDISRFHSTKSIRREESGAPRGYSRGGGFGVSAESVEWVALRAAQRSNSCFALAVSPSR